MFKKNRINFKMKEYPLTHLQRWKDDMITLNFSISLRFGVIQAHVGNLHEIFFLDVQE